MSCRIVVIGASVVALQCVLFDIHCTSLEGNYKLECAVDGAPLQIPALKFLTPQAHRRPTPGHDLANRMKILFNMFSIFYL